MDNQKKEIVKYTIINKGGGEVIRFTEDFLLACRKANEFASSVPGVTFEVWQDALLYETSKPLPKDSANNSQGYGVKADEDTKVEYVVKNAINFVVGNCPSLELAQGRARYLCSQDDKTSFRIFKETKTVVLLEEYQSSIVSEARQEEWIPALVKFQTPPSWWRMVEEKSKLMGTVILVQKLDKVPYNAPCYVPYHYRSVRKGKTEDSGWNWAETDLKLHPTASDIAFVKEQKRLAKGFRV